MAYLSDITLNTKTYSLVSQRPTSSVRSDASEPIDTPKLFTISHETSTSTGAVNSVAIMDRLYTVVNTNGIAKSNKVRGQFKISYNPNDGYVDLETELLAIVADLVAFFSDSPTVDKFLNKES